MAPTLTIAKCAVVVTALVSVAKFGDVEVSVATPALGPKMMAFADRPPAGIVIVGVFTTTAAGLSLTIVITTGPLFAGSRVIEIGKSVICASGTFNVIGAAMVLFDTTTSSDASA